MALWLFWCCLVAYFLLKKDEWSVAGSAVARNTSSSLHLLRRQQQHLLQQKDSALPAKPLKFSKQAFRGSYFSLSNLLISEKYRLVVCPIQKSASTLMSKLVRKMEGHQFWYEDNWNNATGLVTAWQLGAQRLAAIFQDPKWTKAIFFRDPVDRLVSSYQQFLQSQYAYGRYALRVRNGRNMSIPWPAFLADVLEGGQSNIHWNPQTHYCGFHKYWRYYNFIGSFEQLEKHGRKLFDALGPTVWEEHGAKGWAIAGVKQIEGWHYWGEVDQINGQNVTKYVRNLTAVHASVPKSSQQNDCIFCKNYASHRRSRPLAISFADWQAIVKSKYYELDYEQWRRLAAAGNEVAAVDLMSYQSYDRWKAKHSRP